MREKYFAKQKPDKVRINLIYLQWQVTPTPMSWVDTNDLAKILKPPQNKFTMMIASIRPINILLLEKFVIKPSFHSGKPPLLV